MGSRKPSPGEWLAEVLSSSSDKPLLEPFTEKEMIGRRSWEDIFGDVSVPRTYARQPTTLVQQPTPTTACPEKDQLITQLRQSLQRAQAEVEDRDQKLVQWASAQTTTEQRIKALTLQLEEKVKEKNQLEQQLTQELSECKVDQQKISKLEAQILAEQTDKNSLQIQLAALTKEFSDCQSKFTNSSSQIAALVSENAALKAQVSTATQSVSSLNSTEALLRQQLQLSESQRDVAQKSLEELRKQLDTCLMPKNEDKQMVTRSTCKQREADLLGQLQIAKEEQQKAQFNLEQASAQCKQSHRSELLALQNQLDDCLQDSQISKSEAQQRLDQQLTESSRLAQELSNSSASLGAQEKRLEDTENRLQALFLQLEQSRKVAQEQASSTKKLREELDRTEALLVQAEKDLRNETSKLAQTSKTSIVEQSKLQAKSEQMALEISQFQSQISVLQKRLIETQKCCTESERCQAELTQTTQQCQAEITSAIQNQNLITRDLRLQLDQVGKSNQAALNEETRLFNERLIRAGELGRKLVEQVDQLEAENEALQDALQSAQAQLLEQQLEMQAERHRFQEETSQLNQLLLQKFS